jgi:acyl-CoA synthetase (AMP-forming)/AMP-acid ligase II
MDSDGYVKIIGRIKDMIIRGGENIYLKEIEEYLYTLTHICQAQVTYFKIPQNIKIVTGYPMTVTGKCRSSLCDRNTQKNCNWWYR